jgi:hypothetical protein
MRRRHATVLFLAALLIQGCGLVVRSAQEAGTAVANSELFRRGRHGKLNEQELAWAKTAWKYFVNNYHSDTGLVNGTDQFPTTSVWNIADTIAATIAAHRLGLIDDYEFDHRITPLLEFLNNMQLSYGQLPNAFYAADSGKMVDSAGNSFGQGSDDDKKDGDRSEAQQDKAGWSAIDIGRLLIWLQNLRSYAPQYAEYIDKSVLRWSFCQVIDDCGGLHGINRNSSKKPPSRYPEEPLGYQEYALMGYTAWGFSQPRNKSVQPAARIYGIDMPGSREDSRKTGSSNPLVSTPYLLQGLEFNWDRLDDQTSLDSHSSDAEAAELAKRIYAVQERRYQQERIFTARAECRHSKKPYILYDAIFADGYAWNTVTPEGEVHNDLSLVSTSAAFSMWTLWKTSYTDDLMRLISTLHDPERGWFEGRREKDGGYEQTISCATNAMVLEVLHYKAHGKLYKAPTPRSYTDIVLEDEFRRPPCSPPEREKCEK